MVFSLSMENPANSRKIDDAICIPMRRAPRFIFAISENVLEQLRCGIGTPLKARIE
jgi:hypothetical protein